MMDRQVGVIGIETELLDRLLEMHARATDGSNGASPGYWLLYDQVLGLMRRGQPAGESCSFVAMWLGLGLAVAWALGSFAFGWLVGLTVCGGRLPWW